MYITTPNVIKINKEKIPRKNHKDLSLISVFTAVMEKGIVTLLELFR